MIGIVLGIVAFSVSSFGAVSAQARVPWQMPENDFGGATPKNAEKWLTFRDYPASAMRANEQGYVVVSFEIDPKGKVRACEVKRSSGHSSLDEVPCKSLKSRARFTPATDNQGVAKATLGTASFPFWMP